jgi:small subunit ribosomal protein S3
MIEKKFVSQNIKQFMVEEYISQNLKNVGFSSVSIKKTPLGDKIIIHALKPGFIVGRKGESIKKLTEDLKVHFNLENPNIEIKEVENFNLDANIVAERIVSSLERFGSARFKGIGHKVMEDVMKSGALGVEILISGKIPGSRAKRWRFYQGFLKKCGDIALTGVYKSIKSAKLKTGIIGIQVKIMPPNIVLPDNIDIKSQEDYEKGLEETDLEDDNDVDSNEDDIQDDDESVMKKKKKKKKKAVKKKKKKKAKE